MILKLIWELKWKLKWELKWTNEYVLSCAQRITSLNHLVQFDFIDHYPWAESAGFVP